MTIIPVHIPLYVVHVYDPPTRRGWNLTGGHLGSTMVFVDKYYADAAKQRTEGFGYMCEVRELSMELLKEAKATA